MNICPFFSALLAKRQIILISKRVDWFFQMFLQARKSQLDDFRTEAEQMRAAVAATMTRAQDSAPQGGGQPPKKLLVVGLRNPYIIIIHVIYSTFCSCIYMFISYQQSLLTCILSNFEPF